MMVKVCGMTLPEQLHQADQLQVDYLGLIFHRASPRYAGGLRLNSVKLKAKLTGVFVDSPADEILSIAGKFGLSAVQLHGGQDIETCLRLKQNKLEVIRVFHPLDEGFGITADFAHCSDYFLFDSGKRGSGGSGAKFDWQMLSGYQGKTPFFLSGGIGPEDAESILQIRHPAFAGIDLNSRFELSPGIKNMDIIKTFLKQLRS